MKKVLFVIIVSIVCFSIYTHPQTKNVILDQRLSGDTQVGILQKWEGAYFTQYPWINPGASFDFLIGSTQTINGDPSIYLNEKYLRWKRNTSDDQDVTNHHSFTIQPNDFNFTSKFNPTQNGITIKNNLEGLVNVNGGAVWFKDPWYRDYEDPNFDDNIRNRGMKDTGIDALKFRNRPSPFYPNFDTYYPNDTDPSQKYQGVFLSQPMQTGKPFYSVKVDAIQDILLYNTGIPTGRHHNAYFQKWSGQETGVSYSSSNNLETRIMFTQPGAIAKADYKVSSLSDNTNAYQNGNQRKLVKTSTGILYFVYESMNNIWLESSTDNGSNWVVENLGKPITEGSYPSLYTINIDGVPDILITCQHYLPNAQRIFVIQYKPDPINPSILGRLNLTINNPNNYPVYATTAIAWNNNNAIITLYTLNGSIKAKLGHCNIVLNTYWTNGDFVLSSDGITPSLESTSTNFYLVYPNSSNTNMYFQKFHSNSDWTQIISDEFKTLSTGSGYSHHYNPSFIVASDLSARICWKGTRNNYEMDPTTESPVVTEEERVVFRDQGYDNHFWSFGQNVSSPNIQKADDNSYYGFVWNQNGNSTYLADCYTLSTTRLLSDVPGKNVQISNGTNKDQMFAEVFNTNSTLNYFKTSNSIGSYYAPQKVNTYSFSSGREGVIYKDAAQFFFTVGDIIVDGQPVNFVEIPDSISFNSKEILNTYLKSEPFQLTNNSTFMYSVQYGITDSSASASLLSNSNNYINFKLQLIDNQTSEVLGTYDEATYNSSNIYQYINLCYAVNASGVGNRQVHLELVVNDNLEPNYSLGEIYASDNVLEKISRVNISYKGLESVSSYDLTQNYPNPFNPSTTIRYQIPQNGIVTLKIYDILGSEVATLVNEEKLAGKYEVNFSATGGASSLASGVYIYKIQSGSFINSKKMILLK